MLDLKGKTKHSFWTPAEVCELTGLSRATIWREMKAGRLGFVKIRTSRIIRHSQLVAFFGFDPLDEPALIESYLSHRAAPAPAEQSSLFELTEADRDG